MVGALSVKPGVEFAVIAPGGFRLLSALDTCARIYGLPLVITSGTDGAHSGPDDPHHRGEAYDVRSTTFQPLMKARFVELVLSSMFDGDPAPRDGGMVTARFFGWLENAGGPDEHFHFQVRKGVTFP